MGAVKDPRTGRLQAIDSAFKLFWSGGEHPDSPVDVGRAQVLGGVFWLIGGLVGAVLLPLAPPTKQIGAAGWVVAALALVTCFGLAARRLSPKRHASLNELFLSSCLGLLAIAALEWVAGGRGAPYHQLYVLPAIFVGALQQPRRALAFLAAVIAATCLPLLYGPVSKEIVVDLGAQDLMLLALASTARGLIAALRHQRGRLRHAQLEAETRARRDILTGLGNRLAFREAVNREVSRARREGAELSLMIADIKGFKRVNDTYGHLKGDECLSCVAKSIKRAARDGDECFRWGGDEFVVLLPGTGLEVAASLEGRLSGTVASQCGAPGGERVELTCATTTLGAGQDAEGLVASADELLLRLRSGTRPTTTTS